MKKIIFGLVIIFLFNISMIEAYANEMSEDEFIICIDPGHQQKGNKNLEPIGPGSSNKKAKVSQGTAGVGSKKAEYEVNLEAANILKEILIKKGYKVIMTRESHDVNISNAERAEISNKANANITIRIHCDSLKDSSKTGATILVPSKESKYTKNIYDESKAFGDILKDNLKSQNIKVNGVIERNDITGFNWSIVPVVILEMGFMSNFNEDRMLCDKNYQERLMNIVSDAIDNYKENKKG